MTKIAKPMAKPFVRHIARLRRLQDGAGMIEVMIAIVIAGFALLGLAGLQVSALRYQKVANYHALASQFAAEISDRVRANMAGVHAGSYNLAVSSYEDKDPIAPATKSCTDDDASACTPAGAAALDIYRWRKNLRMSMTGGWGEVSGDATSGFTIRIYYKETAVNGVTDSTEDPNCRKDAVPSSEKNVRCFVTVLFP